METKGIFMVDRAWGRGEWRMTASGYKPSLGGKESVLKLVVIVAQP